MNMLLARRAESTWSMLSFPANTKTGFCKHDLNLKKIRKTQKYSFSKCRLHHDVVRVFVSSLVLVFVWAILSWCP